jgi:hypothetical protein
MEVEKLEIKELNLTKNIKFKILRVEYQDETSGDIGLACDSCGAIALEVVYQIDLIDVYLCDDCLEGRITQALV